MTGRLTLRRLFLLRGPSMMMIILLGLQSSVLSAAFAGNTRPSIDMLHPKRQRNQDWRLGHLAFIEQNRRDSSLRRGAGVAAENADSNANSKLAANTLQRELLAEMIGTFLIVQIGTGSVMSAIYTDSLVGLFQIASVWIIAVTVAIFTTASISGAHLNPAISIAFAAVRPSDSFNWKKVLPYSASQLLGAFLGSLVNFMLYTSTILAFESTNNIVRGASSGLASAKAFGEYFVAPVSTFTAFLAEVIGTGVLAFVIFALTNKNNEGVKDEFIPPLIGLTVGALIAVLAPLTQAGFNPARDFGPRIVAWFAGWKTVAFTSAWVYIVAPIVGAVLGASAADKLLYPDKEHA